MVELEPIYGRNLTYDEMRSLFLNTVKVKCQGGVILIDYNCNLFYPIDL